MRSIQHTLLRYRLMFAAPLTPVHHSPFISVRRRLLGRFKLDGVCCLVPGGSVGISDRIVLLFSNLYGSPVATGAAIAAAVVVSGGATVAAAAVVTDGATGVAAMALPLLLSL